ncbi:hypothetical protein BH24GEM3_BH24GEM3_15550 [soil metagenome]
MANSLRDLIFGGSTTRRELAEVITPRWSFEDVILPPTTRRQLEHALAQIRKHDVLFHDWGLAERHSTGLGLAFNFAGPPGTGKTICAEAVANALGKKLLVVRYSELESMWAGNTSKNVVSVFRWAEEQDAVLFFDEADAIASRRFSTIGRGYEREANAVVNVLLRELEEFSGVVIFATNMAANFDPAFERRIRTHILFTMPNVEERELIWRAQLHARKTPLAEDVNFRALAERYDSSGGDIKNAVLKAAQIAISEPGNDREKQIHQRHFEEAIQEVVAGKAVMEQSLGDGAGAEALPYASGAWEQLSQGQDTLQGEMALLLERIEEIDGGQRELATRIEAVAESVEERRSAEQTALATYQESTQIALAQVQSEWSQKTRMLLYMMLTALVVAVAALLLAAVGYMSGGTPVP